MTLLSLFALFVVLVESCRGDGTDRLRFSDRRQSSDVTEYRAFNRRPIDGGSSNIDNVFKIPIAVIKGTAAAAQAFSPQNSQTIQTVFDIPVTTLNAVGEYIKGSQSQELSPNTYYSDDTIGVQRPVSLTDQRRMDRRERLMKLQEERDRRRLMEQEKFFLHGHHSSLSLLSSLLGGGGNLFGVHGHGHGGLYGKPPKRPLKPLKPHKPAHHTSHSGGHHGNLLGGSGTYQVHEQINEDPAQTLGLFSWLQTTSSQPQKDVIQNKIAPGSEFRYDRQRPESRF